MYDYNFPTQLTNKRLTLLLLSQVIPAETVVLKDIYKKKEFLEIADTQEYYQTYLARYDFPLSYRIFNSGEFPCVGFMDLIKIESRMLLRQIRCLRRGFILYSSDEGEGHPITVEVNPLKKLPLVEWFSAEGYGLEGPLEIELFTKKLENRLSPRGIDIVNQIFTEYTKHNDISQPHSGYNSNGCWWWNAPIWNSSPDSKYKMEGPQHIDNTLDERQRDFNDMDISGKLAYVLYEDSEGNGGAILVQEWTNPSSIYF